MPQAATVTAVNGSTGQNITMSTPSGPTITGSGTTTAIARGTQGNTTDDFADVSIISGVTSLTVSYANNPNNPTAGNRSFSIGNFSWSGVLPVKWVSFTGNRQSNGSVLLKWATTSETAVLKYIVERSKDGQQSVKLQPLATAARIPIMHLILHREAVIRCTGSDKWISMENTVSQEL